ncbi:HEPN-associated N-terminal domain-containing protein [Ralstonia pseudosolanacearum]
MGRVKDWLAAEQRQGFDSHDSRVCTRCIEDYALRAFIENNGETTHPCSYCAPDAGNERSVRFNDFMRFLLKGIGTEWGDPNDEGVPWEQGWVGKVYGSYELLTDHLDIGFRTEQLFNDIHRSLNDRQWCQKSFYELKQHQALSAGWQEFTEVVRHESRYLFFRREDPRAKWRGSEEIQPSDFLDALGGVISNCGLYTALAAGVSLCRLRVHAPDMKLSRAQELGPPPAKLARFANRMSAAGITAFYGAFDKATAIAETASSTVEPKGATLGNFKLLRDLYLVDFTKVPAAPSIFEPDSYFKRHGVRFLHRFLDDFTAPIQKDGREHIEYVPTQIVSEYLRFVHRGPEDRPIDGILYRSARHQGQNACVLFFGPEGVSDPGEIKETTVAVLDSVETFQLPLPDGDEN